MPDIYYGNIPDDETAKRNEFLQRIRNWWNSSPTAQYYFGQNTQAPADIINQDAARRAQMGQTLISPLAEALRRRQADTGTGKLTPAEREKYEREFQPIPLERRPQPLTPDQLNMPGLAPPQMPSAPPPPQMPQQAPQGQGQPGLQAYLQQIAAQKQGQQQNMMQLINAVLGGGQAYAKEPEMSRKEKIGQLLMPLGATMSQFGGAMMMPAWARGEAMAKLGNPMMQYATIQGKRQDAAAKRQEQRDMKLMAMMPHLMQMAQGPKESPRIYIDSQGNPQIVPYPVQNERAERVPGSYQAAAVDAYQRGDTQMGDWYSQKAQEQATASARYQYSQPSYGIYPRTEEEGGGYDVYQGPHGAHYGAGPRARQQGKGSFMDEINRGAPGQTYTLRDKQGNVRQVDKATYDSYMRHYNLGQ